MSVDVRAQALGVAQVVLDDRPGDQREPAVDLRQDLVLLPQDDVELLAEDLLVEQVLDPQPDPRGLVRVRGPDPALRRPERVLAEEPLGHPLELEVVRHDHVAVARDHEPRRVDADRREPVHLVQQDPGVDDHAVRDHRGDVRVQDPRGDQLQLERVPLGEDRVAGVVPALVADDEVHPVGQVVGRLALALVPPLGPDDDGGRHDAPVYGRATAGGPDRRLGYERSMRKLIRTCVWYSEITPSSTTARRAEDVHRLDASDRLRGLGQRLMGRVPPRLRRDTRPGRSS